MKTVLSIAGSDSGGGAGIQADIKTCCAFKIFATTAITSLTAQNTFGVEGIMDIPADFVEKQIRAVVNDIRPDAVKIGMLGNAETVIRVASLISELGLKNVVLDPVLIASSGDSLSGNSNETASAIMERLAPLATIMTPNIPEALQLLGIDNDFEDAGPLAVRLSAVSRAEAVLLKGGHGESEYCKDYLVFRHASEGLTVREFSAPRIETKNNHGTGCTLSSAIACGLALGLSLENAVRQGKEYVTSALKSGIENKIGNGTGPLDFFASVQCPFNL